MPAVGPLLVCFALPGEARPFLKQLRQPGCPRVIVTGMGQARARQGIQAALQLGHPSGVLTCGLAGGLDPSLAFGTVVYDADAGFSLVPAMEKAGMIRTQFLCAAQVIVTAREKIQLWKSQGAGAVDMESSVIRQVCRDRQIPSATVRVISDTAQEDLPLDFNHYLDAACRFNYLRLVGDVICSPRRMGLLVRFQRQTKLAAQILARVLYQCLA